MPNQPTTTPNLLNAEDIAARVRKVVCAQFGEQFKITIGNPNCSFQDNLGADSLDVIELSMGLEEEFDITIPDGLDAHPIRTVGEAIQTVTNLIHLKTEQSC